MGEIDDQLQKLNRKQKAKLLGALAELSWSDRKLVEDERGLFRDFADWLGVDREQAAALLEQPRDAARLDLSGLPGRVRALVYVTGVAMVLVDGRFSSEERADLAVLAGSLGIVPESAVQTIRKLKRTSKLRQKLSQALEQAQPLAARQSAEQSAKRGVCTILGLFVGFGVGVFAWPAVVPGAVGGLIAGAVGGGFVGRILVERERFEPAEYDFSDL